MGAGRPLQTLQTQAISAVAFFSAQTQMDIGKDISALCPFLCPSQIAAWVVSGFDVCDLISVPSPAGNSQSSHDRRMTRDTRMALFLMGELVAALRANAPDVFRGFLSEGIQELGVTEVEELQVHWLGSFAQPLPI